MRESLHQAVEHGVLVAESAERAASVSATRCSRKPSTRRSCPVSARNCTRASPKSSRGAERQGRRSSHPTGLRRVAPGKRSPRRSRRRGRRRRSSALQRLSPISSGRSRCGTPCRTQPSSSGSTSPSSAPGRPSWPARRARRRARVSSPARDRAGRRRDLHRSALLHVQARRISLRDRQQRGRTRRNRARGRARARRAALAERAYALGSLAGVLMVAWRIAESLPIARAGACARSAVGAPEAEVRALTVLGSGPRPPWPHRGGSRPASSGAAARRGDR